jgi:hypothetical protein
VIETFKDFLGAWREKRLEDDATWRSYNIPDAVKPEHIREALKLLSLVYAGELALGQFMRLYEITDQAEAIDILQQWYIWHRKARGYSTPLARRRTRPKYPQPSA